MRIPCFRWTHPTWTIHAKNKFKFLYTKSQIHECTLKCRQQYSYLCCDINSVLLMVLLHSVADKNSCGHNVAVSLTSDTAGIDRCQQTRRPKFLFTAASTCIWWFSQSVTFGEQMAKYGLSPWIWVGGGRTKMYCSLAKIVALHKSMYKLYYSFYINTQIYWSKCVLSVCGYSKYSIP